MAKAKRQNPVYEYEGSPTRYAGYEHCETCGALITCRVCGFPEPLCDEVGQRVAGVHAFTTKRETK